MKKYILQTQCSYIFYTHIHAHTPHPFVYICVYPPLFENSHYATVLRPTLVPVFNNRKKSKEDFHFYKNKWKAQKAFSICLAVSPYRGSTYLEQREWPYQLLLRELHSISASSATAVNSVCEHLCFISSIYFVFPLARFVQRYQKSLREFARVLYLA